jgi:hypothetical protein
MNLLKSSVFTACVLFSSTLIASELTLISRNMPTSCEFVFEVESDIKISMDKTISDQKVFYQFQNSWEPLNWTQEKSASVKSVGDQKELSLTLQSMSIPGKYLYRHIRIRLPESKITCIAEFGREFGEVCMPEGRSGTPWRQRVLACETAE